jgi:rhodanese-related sulfurtransferase
MGWPRQRPAVAVEDVDVAAVAGRDPDLTVLLDVREHDEVAEAGIEGSLVIPLTELNQRVEEIPRDVPVFVVCRTGNRSRMVAEALALSGHDKVKNVRGGIVAWYQAGYPITRG